MNDTEGTAPPQLLSDLTLARRLEQTEAQSCVEFAEARARLDPASGAAWIAVAGARAVYDGVRSPVTQTFGLGMFEPATSAHLEEIENFFGERGAPVFHEASPLADQSVLGLLNERGYQPMEFTSVMYRPLQTDAGQRRFANERVRVRLMRDDERELWAQTSAEGWSEFTEYADLIRELALVGTARPGGLSFLAELDGHMIATGAMTICDGVALLAGASTVPHGRKQGAQLALLDNRLRHAANEGCDIAMMCAAPGSASQRNAERQGFRIAYTRIKWRLRKELRKDEG